MNALLMIIGFLLFLAAAYYAGYDRARELYRQPKEQEFFAPQVKDGYSRELAMAESVDESFTVVARNPTWKERRRELEAKQRTKRQKLEEWRD